MQFLKERLSVLNCRDFRMYWIGQSVSLIGSWMQQAALNWIIMSSFNSVMGIASVYFIWYAPMILFSIFGGAVADHFPRKNILIITQVLHAVLSLVYAILIFSHSLSLHAVYIIAFLTGVLIAIDIPTQQAFLSNLVEKNKIQQAVALNLSVFHMARLVGPAIAGFLLIYLSMEIVFLFNAVSFIFVIVSLCLIKNNFILVSQNKFNLKSIREGIAYMKEEPCVRKILGINFISSFLILPFLIVFIAVSVNKFLNGNIELFTLAMSVSGIGAMLGAFIVVIVPKYFCRKVMVLSCIFCSLSLIMAGQSYTVISFIGSIFFVALFVSIIQGLVSSLLQEILPDDIRGRVFGINAVLFAISIPAASILFGWLSDQIGLRNVFIVCALAYGIISLLWLIRSDFWKKGLLLAEPTFF